MRTVSMNVDTRSPTEKVDYNVSCKQLMKYMIWKVVMVNPRLITNYVSNIRIDLFKRKSMETT